MTAQSSPRGLTPRADPRPTPYHRWNPETVMFELIENAVPSAIDDARNTIDLAASRARGRYLTNGVGQDATYTAKYLDAINYVKAGYPADATLFTWINAEASATGLTTTQAADRIKTIGDFWYGLKGPQIEAARIAGKDALETLSTVEAIISHTQGVVSALDAM